MIFSSARGAQFSKVGRNPTNGSWWMFQVQPTSGAALPKSHQRQLVDVSSPTYIGRYFA
jgi:hypothetical protein